MPKYSYLFVLIILLFGGIGLAIQAPNKTTYNEITNAQPILRLSPNQIVPDRNGNIQLHVLLNAQIVAVESVQFKLFYDPQSLQFGDIHTEGSFANAQVVEKKINDTGAKCCHKTGYIQYALKKNPQQTNNDGAIVSLSFHVLRQKGQTGVHFIEAQVNSQHIAPSLLLNSKYNSTITLVPTK